MYVCVPATSLPEVKVMSYLLWQTTSSPDARQHIFSSVTCPDFFFFFPPSPPPSFSLSLVALVWFYFSVDRTAHCDSGMVSSSLAEGHIIFREGRVGWMEGGGEGGKEEVAWRDGGRADARGEMRGRRQRSTSVLVQTRIELLVQDGH